MPISSWNRALGAPPDATGHRRGLTADGRVELVLRAPTDGAGATLRTVKGTFTGPDHIIDVRVLAGAPPTRAAAGRAHRGASSRARRLTGDPRHRHWIGVLSPR
ncbi:MAG: DUF2397 family protein [Pseudonocardiaceae bacterium]